MRLFTCQCGYTFIIGDDHVYGALWQGMYTGPAGAPMWSQLLRTREEWEDRYADCAHYYEVHRPPTTTVINARPSQHVHPFTD